MPLHEAGGGLALACDHGDRLVVEGIAGALAAAAGERADVFVFFGDVADVVGLTLGLEGGDDPFHLRIGDERTMDPGEAAAARHEQQVALAEELFRPLLAEDGAAVDLGGDLEADPVGEVGLDGAGDDVDRGTLGGHDQVDAGGARHLCQALYRGLHVLAGDQHQVRHLVDDDDDERQRLHA